MGFCYRELPDLNTDFSQTDSGWRFTAGDESDEYISNPDNLGMYSLNTICNYDSEVTGILRSPYDSAFEKGKNGKLQRVEDWE